MSRAHWRTARCPPNAAYAHVISPQRHPWARAHCSTARCPSDAAYLQMRLSNFTRSDPFRQSSTIAARAKMVLGCLEGSDREKFERGICEYAASDGHLAVLQWARAREYPWGQRTWSLDVFPGRVPWTIPGNAGEKTCAMAAGNGHLAVLQWARAQGCPWDERVCAGAAEKDRKSVV